MQFVLYTEWGQLPDSAGTLFRQVSKRSVFLSRPWFEALCATDAASPRTLRLACVIEGERVFAILPCVDHGRNRWSALRHRYSPHYGLLLAEGAQEPVLACLAEGLAQLPLSALLLEPIIEGDATLGPFVQVLEQSGFRCESLFRHYNWVLSVAGHSFQAYWHTRPARLRNTTARKARKLEREQGYELRLFADAEVPAAMADYHAVYQASWKANEQYSTLVEQMVEGFSREGWTRLGVLYVQGRPAAAQLWFVHNGRASIFRLAYDEAWKRYSPGSILTAFLMQHVIDVDKVCEVDFLTGNDAYKQDWMSERRQCLALSSIRAMAPKPWYARLLNTFTRR